MAQKKPITLEKFAEIFDDHTKTRLLVNYDRKTDMYEEITDAFMLLTHVLYAPDYFVTHAQLGTDGVLEIEVYRPDLWFKQSQN